MIRSQNFEIKAVVYLVKIDIKDRESNFEIGI